MGRQLTAWVLVLVGCGLTLGAQSRLPESAGLWALLEPPSTAAHRAPTPQESALIQQLMAQAQKEAVADTDLLPLVGTALKSDNPHVRANALTMLQFAMLSLRATPGVRSPVRQAVLTDSGWPLVRDGWRDADGGVRRYALTTAMSLDLDEARRSELTALCATLFERDPEPMVRVASLGWLLRLPGAAGGARALIERAIGDRSPSVKAAGFSALWTRQVPDFVPFVLGKLHDESDRMNRITAAAALLNVVTVDPSVMDAVSARLALETDPQVRQRLAGTVAQMREIAARTKKPGAND